MSEEVKIRVSEERSGNALNDAVRRMDELKAKIAELNRLEATYTEKGIKTAAADVRSERIPHARELREIERQITGEQREQAAIAKAQNSTLGQRAAFSRMALSGLGTGLAFAGGAYGEYSEWQGVSNRSAAQREIDSRQIALRGSRGFSDSGAIGAVRSREDEIFKREQERAELERKVKSGAVTQGLVGAAGGALVGAQIGSIIPGIGTAIGAAVGAAIGGGVGAARGYSAGKRDLSEADAAQVRDKANLDKERADQRWYFSQEGGRQIEIAEKVALGEMAAARAAEHRLKYHKDLEAFKAQGADFSEATRGADANFSADLRLREQSMGSLITARTGASAAARLAGLAERQREQTWSQVVAQKMDEQIRADANARSPKLQRMTAKAPLR